MHVSPNRVVCPKRAHVCDLAKVHIVFVCVVFIPLRACVCLSVSWVCAAKDGAHFRAHFFLIARVCDNVCVCVITCVCVW